MPGSAPPSRAVDEVSRIVGWYLTNAYGAVDGPAKVPYFADPERVGPFAVDLDALRRRDNDALFRLLVLMGLYQSRRDVDIMALQRAMPAGAATALLAPRRLRVLVERNRERVDLRDPVATDRVSAVAHRAIDQLDVVLSTGQNDQRNRRLGLGHAVSRILVDARQCKQSPAASKGRESQTPDPLSRSGFDLTPRASL